MHARRAQVDETVSAAPFITTSYSLPPSTAISLVSPVSLSRQYQVATCCGVEVVDKENLLDTTAITARKVNLDGGSYTGDSER
jgi:hypothetical protein